MFLLNIVLLSVGSLIENCKSKIAFYVLWLYYILLKSCFSVHIHMILHSSETKLIQCKQTDSMGVYGFISLTQLSRSQYSLLFQYLLCSSLILQ